MPPTQSLLHALCGGPPDRRPLYRYRIDDLAFAKLQVALRTRLELADPAHLDRASAALFCLFAAEWCRRHREGGAWAWEPIKAAIGIACVDDHHVRDWVHAGLRELGRPIMHSDAGHRRFLLTLACEGGLPLKRLAVEGARLRTFFRRVMVAFHDLGRTGEEPLDVLAADAARFDRELAAAFRNEVVHYLAADLVAAIWRLRPHLVDAEEDGLAALDARVPGWRDTLPLVASDATAEALLSGLVADARRPTTDLRVTTRLVRGPEPGTRVLTRELDAPSTWSVEELRRVVPALGSDVDLPLRFQLRLTTRAGSASPAGVLRTGSSGWTFHPSITPLKGLGVDGDVEVELFSRRTGALTARATAGAGELGPLPWVFRPHDDGSATLVATGSARHTDEVLLVACHPADTLAGDVEPTADTVQGRPIHRVRGVATVATQDGTVRIVTRADRSEAHTHEAVGEVLLGLTTHRPIWRGMPRVVRRTPFGRQEVPLEVRVDGAWVPARRAPFGDVEVRALEGGELTYRRRLLVVPPDLTLTMEQVGTSVRPGVLCATSEHLSSVGTPVDPEGRYAATASRDRSTHRLAFATTEAPPPKVPVTLAFASGQVTGTVPFPVQALRFEDADGNPVEDGKRIHIRHLGRYTAVGVSPNGRTTMAVDLSIHPGTGLVPAPITRVLREQFGVHRLPLRELQSDAEALLDMTNALDARVQLRLSEISAAAQGQRRLDVRRYDWTLEPDHALGDVELETDKPLDEEDFDKIEVEARAFANIGDAFPLARLRSARKPRPTWAFEPDRRPPGSYLITLSEGGWHRCRPVPMTGRGPGERPSEGLAGAMQIPQPRERAQVTRVALAAMAADASHADWRVLDGFFPLLGTLPAATFDVHRELVTMPEVAAMVGLRIAGLPPAEFTAAWDGLEQLVFLWEAIPVDAWRQALDRHHAHLASLAPDFATAELGARIAAIRPELPALDHAVALWCRTAGVDLAAVGLDAGQAACLHRDWSGTLLGLRDDELRDARNRHRSLAHDVWPRLPPGLDLPPVGRWGHPVATPFPDMDRGLSAPTALALTAAQGDAVDPHLIVYLSELRAFDETLFRQSYTYALGAILADLHGA